MKHVHEYTRRKAESTVATCRCGAFRHTEHAGPAILEQSAPMSGTEWVEPGQGATVAQLENAVDDAACSGKISTSERNRAMDILWGWKDARTILNLRLIGELTSEDVNRIAEAK